MKKIRFWIKVKSEIIEEIISLPDWIEYQQIQYLYDNWKKVKLEGNWDILEIAGRL